MLCIPVNDTCQWYNPCRYWRGFCQSGYRCGTVEQYYAFIFGPQPLCVAPPEGWVEPLPPGDCIAQEQECRWSNCVAYLDWCRTSWTCDTQYDKEVYFAGPPPPCPPPPPGWMPPPQPGVCQFNVTAMGCQFQPGEITTTSTTTPISAPTASTCRSFCSTCPTCRSRHNFEIPLECAEVCSEECACRVGTVFDDLGGGGCVPPDSCGVIQDDACVLGIVQCPSDHTCVPWTSSPQRAVCMRSCASNNGGCPDEQICVERPFCSLCELRAEMDGHCEDRGVDGTAAGATSGSSKSHQTVAIVGAIVGVLVGSSVILISLICIGVLCARYNTHKGKKVNSTYKNDGAAEQILKHSELQFQDSIESSSTLEKEDLSMPTTTTTASNEGAKGQVENDYVAV